ncbi:hypothetical protein V2A60_010352 [Cordyceps javanica]|uniref:Uncharacterized protein n=1 Tax=Cordyceps javanica TaxID=43265 RepID=A0A545VUN8_9HYPO|nr:hypothetical protein IF1G_07791 [Cordyceps javanica]TQW05425.1 hypothetical protein IF2G_07362 [Cordyceps javanica]
MATAPTPLELTDSRIMQQLGHVLWSWPLCSCCAAVRVCADEVCIARLSAGERYFRFYEELIGTYVDEGFEATRVFKTHEDLFAAIQTLRAQPSMTQKQLVDAITARRAALPGAITAAVGLTVKVLTMVDPSSSRFLTSPSTLELGRFRTPWRDYVPFCDYIHDMFPACADPTGMADGNSDRFADVQAALRAVKLKKKLNLTLRLTHDLRDHLRFDRRRKILDIFHLTTFLKEQLRLSKGIPSVSTSNTVKPSVPDSVDILPRQLLLETLSSIQQILFPPSDRRSRRLLQSLIVSAGCDPDAARYESAAIRRPGDGTAVRYIYWAARLEDLHEEMQNPQPDGWLDRLLERKSRQRHAMCVTVAGLVVALLLGVGSLAAGIFQAAVAYLAWKHP